MFGSSAEAYKKMYIDGYLVKPFTFEYTNEKKFGFSVIGGDSQEPAIINETIFRFKKEAIKRKESSE